MVPVEGEEAGPGTFHAIVSSEKQDRDGDELWAGEWEQPLPEHIVINGDHDNQHIMSTVGSGPPTLEADNKIHVRGTYAETQFAQETRKLVNGKHLRSLSCAYREKTTTKGVSRELVNASFVVVPSNTDCVVLDSKSFEPVKATDELSDATKAFIKSIVTEAFSTKNATEFSQTPEAPPNGADSSADHAKEKALAIAGRRTYTADEL